MSYFDTIYFKIFQKILMSNQLNQHKVLNNTLELDIFNSQITQVTKLLNVKFIIIFRCNAS